MLFLKLDNLITDCSEDDILPFKHFTFNGGEEHIRIDEEFCPAEVYMHGLEVLIEVSLTSSSKLMQLLMATDALRRLKFPHISLFAPYLPYARQDRVCNPGEALSIKVVCDLLNSQNYHKVYTLDNHSDVSTALLNNHCEIDLERILRRTIPNLSECTLVSPDAGALKKTYKLAKSLGGLPVVECSKRRNVETGEILGVDVWGNPLLSEDRLLIVDDIVDGGRTFIELAKKLKEKGVKQIELYVSHGIFSGDTNKLRMTESGKPLINEIYTTKSFKNITTNLIGVDFELDDL